MRRVRRWAGLLLLLLAGLLLWAVSITLIGLVWTAIWVYARENSWWLFSGIATIMTITWRVTGRSRKVRHRRQQASTLLGRVIQGQVIREKEVER